MDKEYFNWLQALKLKIRSTQIKAAIAVNSALIEFYWELGKMINEKQTQWGSKFLETLSKDLKEEFPDMGGLSKSNLKYCRLFYNFYAPAIGQQLVGQLQATENKIEDLTQQSFTLKTQQIPWGHNINIFTKSKDIKEANFYLLQTIENNWSRDILALQIKSHLYARQGKSINNFQNTLPEPFSDLARQTLKDPYIFDFLTMTTPYKDREIERQLVQHISRFLLELGKGFAFIGQQYHIEIGENDYYIDLLFYHVKLKSYVVIELKNTKFIPEYAGKLNFYLSAIDKLLKTENDKPTIGILLCRDKDNIEVEFALQDINKPIGVSEFNFTEILPEEFKSSLPTIEEIENELKKLN